jgi:acetyl esterase/lipase
LVQALFALASCGAALDLAAQPSDAMKLGAALTASHRTLPNVTYITESGYDAKMDVYVSRDSVRAPTLIYIHGGGWTGGTKEQAMLQIMPWLAMGWTVANVEYRLARNALAPAAVEDARCALRWVVARAKDYNVDTTRIVLTGHSAGGHLALTTGMLPVAAGLDRECVGTQEVKVAAIVNWYGIADVVDLLDGPNMKAYAVAWLGSMTNREDVARRVSPLTYVRAGLPPVITIHGDADPTVPYTQALRLRDALTKAGVPNELVTIPGGHHGGFTREEDLRAYSAIDAFLRRHGVISQVAPGTLAAVAADPKDVGSADAIVAAVYDVISGPAGQKRDWDRFRSLFVPGARLIPTSIAPDKTARIRTMTPDEYAASAGTRLEQSGFFEREIARTAETFGSVTHAFSTYESRRAASDEKPFARGINSIQLFNDGKRWWVVTIYWDSEREGNAIPQRYLGKPGR